MGARRPFADAQQAPIGSPRFLVLYRPGSPSSWFSISGLLCVYAATTFSLWVRRSARPTSFRTLIWMRCLPHCYHPYPKLPPSSRTNCMRGRGDPPHGRCASYPTLGAGNTEGLRTGMGLQGSQRWVLWFQMMSVCYPPRSKQTRSHCLISASTICRPEYIESA